MHSFVSFPVSDLTPHDAPLGTVTELDAKHFTSLRDTKGFSVVDIGLFINIVLLGRLVHH